MSYPPSGQEMDEYLYLIIVYSGAYYLLEVKLILIISLEPCPFCVATGLKCSGDQFGTQFSQPAMTRMFSSSNCIHLMDLCVYCRRRVSECQ